MFFSQCIYSINNIKSREASVTQNWKQCAADMLECVPDFNEDDIRNHACGPYVCRLSTGYYQHSDNIKFMVHSDHPDTIRCDGIVSRHSRNDKGKKQYRVYHRFGMELSDTISYCTCKSGQRSVGMCSHMTVSLIILLYRIHNVGIPIINTRTEKYRKHCQHIQFYNKCNNYCNNYNCIYYNNHCNNYSCKYCNK
eukprot:293730_1